MIDSLTRGFQEKLKPDNLILEINSSRYAYNMSLKEVNFNVVKALFNLNVIREADEKILSSVNEVFNVFGGVVRNYIKTEESMEDCLSAIEVRLSLMTFFRYKKLTFNFVFRSVALKMIT